MNLSFEEDQDQLKDPARLRAFIARYHLTYTVLLAGVTDQLNEKIPQAEHLNSWPTSFILGRDGRVREVHAGFAGPANPAAHAALIQEMTDLVDRLLEEPVPANPPRPADTLAEAPSLDANATPVHEPPLSTFLPGHFLFAPTQRIHFIGIGGIGMSGIAEILLTMGYAVSGSDLRRSSATARLESLGATIFEGHTAHNASNSDVVVTSSAVARDNPEVLEARARKTPVIQRAEMLAELMRLKYGIAVAGMHGKTTTTSMIAAVLAAGGLDPTIVVGGRVDALGSNARLGSSQYLVAEADESDRSFLKLSPVLAVVTNLDREHMDTYRDLADIESAFTDFMDKVPFYGAVTACVDNAMLRAILPRVRHRIHTYGTSADADFQTIPLPCAPGTGSRFDVNYHGLLLGPFDLHVPGRHNVLNATAAVAIAIQLSIPPSRIAEGLATFRGVDRRFQIKGTRRGVTVVDGYGHHPTEVLATLAAAAECNYTAVHVLFQPHRYTRTRDLWPEFLPAFNAATTVEIVDIYSAGEAPIPGITAEALVAEIAHHTPAAAYGFSWKRQSPVSAGRAQPGSIILTLGAGSVSQAGPMLPRSPRHLASFFPLQSASPATTYPRWGSRSRHISTASERPHVSAVPNEISADTVSGNVAHPLANRLHPVYSAGVRSIIYDLSSPPVSPAGKWRESPRKAA